MINGLTVYAILGGALALGLAAFVPDHILRRSVRCALGEHDACAGCRHCFCHRRQRSHDA